MADTNLLVEEIAALPVRPGVGMRILRVLDDPRSSAKDLGRLIEADPALTTQVIRLANTAFYGLSGQVGSAWRAVTVLGHSTVRALAASSAFGLLSEPGDALPPEFWPHSTLSAAAATVIAAEASVSPEDAFSAGLLLDLGHALMYRRARSQYLSVHARCEDQDLALVTVEREEFGVSHADIGAYALESVRFPRTLVEAVRDHHRFPEPDQHPLTRVAIAAAALAFHLEGGTPESHVPIELAFESLGISVADLPGVCAATTDKVGELSGFLGL